MLTVFIKKLYTFSSFSGVLMFYLIGKKIDIPGISWFNYLSKYAYLKYLILLGVVIGIAWLSINLSKKLTGNDSVLVKSIKPIEGVYMPVYIGLFVVALEMSDTLSIESLILLGFLFLLWNCFESVSYFNPFFMLFGYRFYEVTTDISNNKSNPQTITLTVITKRKDLKNIEQFNGLKRLNNFTFIEIT